MDLTAWVDVAIGMILVYVGMSLFGTALNELVARAGNLRGRLLCEGLQNLIRCGALQEKLQKNPALENLFGGSPQKAASYVDPNLLASVLLGSAEQAGGVRNAPQSSLRASCFKQMADTVEGMQEPVRQQLRTALNMAGGDPEKAVAAVGHWVQRSLDATSGEKYKKCIQSIGLLVALALAVGLNVDSVALAKRLYRDKEARVAVAQSAALSQKTQNQKESLDERNALPSTELHERAVVANLPEAVRGRNASIGMLPIGWTQFAADWNEAGQSGKAQAYFWICRVVGWLLTVLAISLGSSFWFDLLSKAVNLRYGMSRPEAKEPSQKEGSQARA